METIIIGGDARFEYLARLLSERGESVGMYGGNACPRVKAVDRAALGRADTVVMNCPPKSDLKLEEVLEAVSDGTLPEERIDASLRRILRVKLRL